jgi:putative proteasome-type protease
MRLNAGLVFLSDSRTNAGVDHIGTFRKLSVFENPGDRMMVLMTAGNLSISQSIRQTVAEFLSTDGTSIWSASSMYEAAQIVGDAIRSVHQRDAKSLEQFGIDFNVSMIFGGQIKGERCRLFQMYAAGNFIESHDENPYFQIGEAKYGMPIIDRVITPTTPLEEAAKCALISMDSTLRSNVSVGLPIDIVILRRDECKLAVKKRLDETDLYFSDIRRRWSEGLRSVFQTVPDPDWKV